MPFIRNAWQVAAFSSEISDAPLPRRLCNQDILFYRTSAGTAVAMEDLCPHRLVPLSLGCRRGDDIECGYHGLRFGPSGACTLIPGQNAIPAAARVATFPLVERWGIAWIWLGAADLADPALIPELEWIGKPGWATGTGYLHFKAGHQLVTDNLLDLSHETYIHGNTIGNGHDQSIAQYPVHASIEGGRMVRAHREMPAIAPPPFFAMLLAHHGEVHEINRWQSAVFQPPGLNMTDVGVYPVGTPREGATMLRVMHLLTPETEESTHYFWAMARNSMVDNDALTHRANRQVDDTFNEDREILERQQANLRARPGRALPGLAVRVDAAPMQARRLYASVLTAEQADASVVVAPVRLATDQAPVALAAE